MCLNESEMRNKLHFLDDLIVNKITNDEIYIVSNASMMEQDFGLLSNAAEKFGADLTTIETSLVAIQVLT